MKFKKYLNEKKLRILKPAIRNKMNKEIQKLLKPTYFKKIPLDPLFSILEKYGVVPLQEDSTYWDGFLLGGVDKTEQVYFDLGWKDTFSVVHTLKVYERVSNAMLALTYYKMDKSNKYEIIAYIS